MIPISEETKKKKKIYKGGIFFFMGLLSLLFNVKPQFEGSSTWFYQFLEEADMTWVTNEFFYHLNDERIQSTSITNQTVKILS